MSGGSGSGSGSGSGGGGNSLGPLKLGPDGVVRGGNGNDNIFPGYKDSDGDRVDSNDARLPTEGGNDDIIYANGGNDTVNAGSGNDYVDAGSGNDVVQAGSGHDVVAGNAGNDTIDAGTGNDTVFGGGGNDSIRAGFGNDRIYGDNESGNTGNLLTNGNFSQGGAGWQRIDGNGDGVVPYISGDARFNTGGRAAGRDAIQQTFATNIGAEHTVSLDLYENNGGVAHHGFRIDVLDADGNVISSESVAVQNNTTQKVSFTFTATTPNTTLRITNTTATGKHQTSDGKVDNVSVVEAPSEPGNDTIYAEDGDDWVDAGDGNDIVDGGIGHDTLLGGRGNDTLTGGIGNDSLDGGANNDILFGNDGADTINGGDGDDFVDGGHSSDVMDGGDGIDTVTYENSFGTAAEFVELDLQAGTGRLNGGPDVETVRNFENAIGSRGNDKISGTDGDNELKGGGGNDTLDGRGGNDRLFGGDSNDLVIGGQGIDHQDGGAGNDTVSFDGANGDGVSYVRFDMATGGVSLVNHNNQVVGHETATNFENAIGSSGNDWITADGGDNRVEGGGGNDLVQGGAGDDTLEGDGGNDYLIGGGDNDLIDGGEGSDRLYGQDGSDTFVSSEGHDTVDGGADRDTYKSADPDDDHIDAYIDNAGGGYVDKLGTGGRDTLSSVEHYVADETANDDSITLTTAVTDVSTITGLDNSATGVFTSSKGQTIQFGGQGQPTLRDILDGNVQGIFPRGTYQITSGDESGQIGNISFENFEEINFTVVCFTAGTRILTPNGDIAVDALNAGDLISTKDRGAQAIRWIGCRHIPAEELDMRPHLKPVRICAGALGTGLPNRDLIVSPQHRVLISSKIAERMFGQKEVLIAAKKLTKFDGIEVIEDNPDGVFYYHFLCENHELVWSEGAITETLFTGAEALKSLSPVARDEIFEIFPELKTGDESGIPTLARTTPRGAKLRSLLDRLQRNKQHLVSSSPDALKPIARERHMH
ncbi:Hint domain-containing protein [Shimia sp. MMG029]|uniref:Hint domain-containing protein n=1 Tax=Shimia sp. MMG029 TaxID=3021978 RepID=UPI0022FE3591|nr:Hint domain-containing protein [Shimia sp. MMG029]MDA5559010.1 Hint domain-containing protein [Shimia sp. MMG029]